MELVIFSNRDEALRAGFTRLDRGHPKLPDTRAFVVGRDHPDGLRGMMLHRVTVVGPALHGGDAALMLAIRNNLRFSLRLEPMLWLEW